MDSAEDCQRYQEDDEIFQGFGLLGSGHVIHSCAFRIDQSWGWVYYKKRICRTADGWLLKKGMFSYEFSN